MTRLKKVWALWPVWLFLLSLIPGVLFWYRWCEWDFQPSWLALAKFVSDFYMPVATFASVWVVMHQISSKWKADRTTLLSDGFRRHCSMLELRMPRTQDDPPQVQSPESIWKAVKAGDIGARVDFLRNHSMFLHALLETGRTLARLEKVDPLAASMFRMELFMTIKRDHFHKYEEICVLITSPRDYTRVCR